MLFDMLLKKCLNDKIILPEFTTFSCFIASIVEKTEERLYKQLALISTNKEKKQLLNLLELVGTSVYGVTIKMDILRTPLTDYSLKEISREFERLKQFQTFSTENWQIKLIPDRIL